MNKLNVKALAFACAALWGLGVLFLGLISMFGWGTEAVSVLGSLYLGFSPTPVGTLIGLVWAIVDGGLAGALLAIFYNLAG